ncbi:pyrrolidone-carboxylate peptidase [Streptococcus pneumoniae]|nr:pyrrolidone-carboxylate peptidase [Streptococcus pneumoniae]
MKVLVTGFEPFGGEKGNPALEAIKGLPAEIHGADSIQNKGNMLYLFLRKKSH